MKTEQAIATTSIKSNIEIGVSVVREVDTNHKYRVVYITSDYKAVAVSKKETDTTAIIDLLCMNGWLKVIESEY
jgi:hypothetical protein